MSAFEIIEVPTTTVAVVRRQVPPAEISDFFGSAFEQVAQAVAAASGAIAGPPFGWYHGMAMDPADISAGFPVSGAEATPDAEVQVVERPGGRVAAGMHVGPYDQLNPADRGVVCPAPRGLRRLRHTTRRVGAGDRRRQRHQVAEPGQL